MLVPGDFGKPEKLSARHEGNGGEEGDLISFANAGKDFRSVRKKDGAIFGTRRSDGEKLPTGQFAELPKPR